MGSQLIQTPVPTEYDPHYAIYIDPVARENVLEQLNRQARSTAELLAGIPESRAGFRYAPGKWSIRQVIGHVADAERIFSYRARTGTASGKTISVRALAFIILGHERHHISVIKARYLNPS